MRERRRVFGAHALQSSTQQSVYLLLDGVGVDGDGLPRHDGLPCHDGGRRLLNGGADHDHMGAVTGLDEAG